MVLTPREKTEMLDLLSKALQIVQFLPAPKCPACEFMDNGVCSKFGEAPPESFQIGGCNQFIERIPF